MTKLHGFSKPTIRTCSDTLNSQRFLVSYLCRNSHKAILAREALYEFCCSFLKTAYDPFMRSIKVGSARIITRLVKLEIFCPRGVCHFRCGVSTIIFLVEQKAVKHAGSYPR